MKKAILLAFIICQSSFIIAQAQQVNLDSLYSIWQDETKPDSSRTSAYTSYIKKGFLFTNPDTAFFLAQKLQQFGDVKHYKEAKALANSLMGVSHALRSNNLKAVEYLKQSLKIYEEIGDKHGIGQISMNIGVVYTNIDDYPKAIEYYQRSLKIANEIGDKGGKAAINTNIGVIYYYQGDYFKTLEYFQRSLKIADEIGDKELIATNNNKIGVLHKEQGNYPEALEYFQRSLKVFEGSESKQASTNAFINIGGLYFEQGNYPKALEYFQQGLKILEEIEDKKGTAKTIASIASVYNDQGDYPKALEYFQQSLKIADEIGDKTSSADRFCDIGRIYINQGYYLKALENCATSLAISEEIGAKPVEKLACECLYDTYKSMGKSNEALVYLEKIQVIDDSLNTQEMTKKLQQMEFQKVMLADSIAKAEEARLLEEAHEEEVRKKDTTRNIAFGAGALLLLLAGGLYTRIRYIRKSKAIIESERDRSDNLLLNILPAEIAQELKEKGKADARDFDMVSILFTDFKGFTEQSAKLSAADLVNEINHCFEAFDGIIEKYNVEKIKTIGDAYMAAGGLPVPTDDSVKTTVLAALEMQTFITKRKAENDAANKPAFEMRVGIHTGPVVAGIVGVKKFQYDIWGDTVNTAARMESSGEIGKVNISQATYELLKDDPQFVFESRGKIEAKGKGTLDMYFVSMKA